MKSPHHTIDALLADGNIDLRTIQEAWNGLIRAHEQGLLDADTLQQLQRELRSGVMRYVGGPSARAMQKVASLTALGRRPMGIRA